MSHWKGKKFDDVVRSQHDARIWASDNGADTEHETGNYWAVKANGKGTAHLNDCCRTMPKQERELVKFWFFCLGLPVAIGVVAFVTRSIWMPLVFGA